jgi:hypothetical protein
LASRARPRSRYAICRNPAFAGTFWWPRFAAEIEFGHATTSIISRVRWIDDPGERSEAIVAKACEIFLLRPLVVEE